MKNVIERTRNGWNLFARRNERKRFPRVVFFSSSVLFFDFIHRKVANHNDDGERNGVHVRLEFYACSAILLTTKMIE